MTRSPVPVGVLEFVRPQGYAAGMDEALIMPRFVKGRW